MHRSENPDDTTCADWLCKERATDRCEFVDDNGTVRVTVDLCAGHADLAENQPGRWRVTMSDGSAPQLGFVGP